MNSCFFSGKFDLAVPRTIRNPLVSLKLMWPEGRDGNSQVVSTVAGKIGGSLVQQSPAHVPNKNFGPM